MPSGKPPFSNTETAPESPNRPAATRTENRIGRYVLLDQLGEGGIGVVIKAYDPKLDRAIALKLLHRSKLDDDARVRFEREAQAIARLRHPNVVTVYDVGEHDGEPFLAMELVRGGSLADWLGAERRSPSDVLRVFRQAAQGLIAAHEHGIVHRDFKPANVLIDDEDGSVRVADFGLARSIGTDASAQDEAPSAALDQTITRTGAVMGTPAYMAPEQLSGGSIDSRADQYSFCVSLYEGLTGARPPKDQRLTFPAGRVPLSVQRALRRGLAADPRDRFASMKELLRALTPRRRGVLAAALVAGGLVAATIALARPSGTEAPCANLGAPLEALWTPDAKRAVVASFTPLHPDGRAIAERLVEVVDEQAARWTAERTAACLATAHGEQSEALLDRRMLCYDRQLTAFAAFAASWTNESDSTAVEHAMSRFVQAFDLQSCTPEILVASPDPPSEPNARHVMTLVDQARAERLLRRRDSALKLADEGVMAARALGNDAVLAEALHQRAQALQSHDLHAEALEVLHEAALAAGRGGYQRLVIIIAGDITFELSERLGRIDEALAYGRLAAAMALSMNDDLELRARISADLGIALYNASHYDEAERYLRIALDAQRQLDRPYDLFQALNGLGNVLQSQAKFDEAEALFTEAIEFIQKLEGRSTRKTRAALNNLATVLDGRGQRQRALEIYGSIAAEELEAFGPDSRELFYPYANMADVYLREQEPDKALHYSLEVVALYDRRNDPRNNNVAVGCNYAAKAHLERAEPRRALELLSRARAIEPAADATPTDDLALTLELNGEALRQLGELEAASAAFEDALEVHAALNSPPWDRAYARFGLARVMWDQGHRREAVDLARRTHDELLGSPRDMGPLPARVERWLADRP